MEHDPHSPTRFGFVRRSHQVVNRAGVAVGPADEERDLSSWLGWLTGNDGGDSGSSSSSGDNSQHGDGIGGLGGLGGGVGGGSGGGVVGANTATTDSGGAATAPTGAASSPHSRSLPTQESSSSAAASSPASASTTPASSSKATTKGSSHETTSSSASSGSVSNGLPAATVTAPTVSATSTSGSSSSGSSGMSAGAVVGIVAALGVVAGVGFWAYRRWSRNRREDSDHSAALAPFGLGGAGQHQELHSNAGDGESDFQEKGGSAWSRQEKEDNWNGGGQAGVGAQGLNRNSSWGNEGTLMGLQRQNTLPLGAEAGSPYGHQPPPAAYNGYGPPPPHPYGAPPPQMGMPPHMQQMRNMGGPPPGSPGFYPPPMSPYGGGYPGSPSSPHPLLGPGQPGTPGGPYGGPAGPNPINGNFRQLTTSPAPMGAQDQQQHSLNRMPSSGTMHSGGNPFSPQGSTFGSQAGHMSGENGPPTMPTSPTTATGSPTSAPVNPFSDHPDAAKVFTVVRTFEPNPEMDDELMIYPNDKILILATYDDGWSTGVNLCHPEPRRQGVFPRDCVDLAPPSEQCTPEFARQVALATAAPAEQQPQMAQPGQPFQAIPEEDEGDHPLSPRHNNVPVSVPVVREPAGVSSTAPSLPSLNFQGPGSPSKAGAALKRSSSLMASRDAELYSALGDVGGRGEGQYRM